MAAFFVVFGSYLASSLRNIISIASSNSQGDIVGERFRQTLVLEDNTSTHEY